MGFSIANALRLSFDLAAARKQAETVRAPHQWARIRLLRERCDRVRNEEIQTFRDRYATRVERARRNLIGEAGSPARGLDHPLFPRDRFSVEDTLRQAQRLVQARHEARLAQIDTIELRELRAILQTCARENTLKDTARDAFFRATDRRRRQPIGPSRAD